MGGLLRNINNFSFEFNAMINQEITILDGVGLPAGLPDGEAGIKTSYSPTGALIGAELGNFSSRTTSKEYKFHL